jgi:hypothetical protein
MSAPAASVARMLAVIRTSSSAPAIVENGEGTRFVLKLVGSGAGPRGLLTEFLGTAIASAAGLPVPEPHPLLLAPDFPWQVGTDEFDDVVRRSAGWNLGLRFIPDESPLLASDLDALPKEFTSRLRIVDAVLQNVDRTRGNPNLLRSPAGLVAIDFGSCLFLNRIAAGMKAFPFALPSNHFLAGANGSAEMEDLERSVTTRICTALSSLVEACPDDWLASLPFGREELAARLEAYVQAFARRGAAQT